MMWLFGQIWLWLLAAFFLGAGIAVLVMQPLLRRPQPAPARGGPRYPVDDLDVVPVGPPVAAEQTQDIPAARLDEPHGRDAAHPPKAPEHWPEEEPAEPPHHRQGVLPTDGNAAGADEPRWPEAEDSGQDT